MKVPTFAGGDYLVEQATPHEVYSLAAEALSVRRDSGGDPGPKLRVR